MTLRPRRGEQMEHGRRRDDDLMPYPTGYSWKEFVASTAEKSGAFMLVLERRPEWNEYVFSEESLREYFFGCFHRRADGLLGKLCFGQMSQHFGGRETKATQPEIIQVQAFSPAFLRTPSFEEGETPNFATPMDYKVVELVTGHDRIDDKLSKFISWFMDVDGEKNVPGEDTTKRMHELLTFLEDYFFLFLEHEGFPSLSKSKAKLKELGTRVEKRREWLKMENHRLHKQIEANAIEIAALQ